jgi:hypothetical protein
MNAQNRLESTAGGEPDSLLGDKFLSEADMDSSTSFMKVIASILFCETQTPVNDCLAVLTLFGELALGAWSWRGRGPGRL